MADEKQDETEKAIQASRDRRKKVAESKKQPAPKSSESTSKQGE